MDKFGIFKLLNSFFNFYEQNKSVSSSEADSAPPINLANIFGEKPQNNTSQKNAPQRATLPPLQSSMLSTINSHDELVKRVKSKNSAPK